MNKQAEALKLALDFLMTRRMGAESVIDALQEALAQPEQEPVAQWQKKHPTKTEGKWENTNGPDAKWWRDNSEAWEIRALYTFPPAQQCTGCEGNPSPQNNPCAVCGKPAQQEPVAWMHPNGRIWTFGRGLDKSTFTVPLYTSPPAQRPGAIHELLRLPM